MVSFENTMIDDAVFPPNFAADSVTETNGSRRAPVRVHQCVWGTPGVCQSLCYTDAF